MALSNERDTLEKAQPWGSRHNAPVAANVKIYRGAAVAFDADGNLAPASTATDLKSAGRADETVDNTGGSAGDKRANFCSGVFLFANDGMDPAAQADVAELCYFTDDETVSKTDGTGTKSAAGKIYEVTADGVYVAMAYPLA